MIFVCILAPVTMSPWESGDMLHCSKTLRGALWRLHNSVGPTLKAPKFRGAKIDCKFSPQSFRAFKVRPAELWSLQSAPRGVLEQCNVCPAFSWRHSYGDQNTHKNHLKNWFSVFFFTVIFVNHCCFRDLYNQYDNFLRNKYFTRWYL